jgi:hypothetical protein
MNALHREARRMADTPNPRVKKLANGLYTVRDYERPKDVSTGELRRIADEARKVQIRIPNDNPNKPT